MQKNLTVVERGLEYYATIEFIEQKLTDALTTGKFGKSFHREHGEREKNFDLLIKFLQKETELEECLSTKPTTAFSFGAKTKSSMVIITSSHCINNRCAL